MRRSRLNSFTANIALQACYVGESHVVFIVLLHASIWVLYFSFMWVGSPFSVAYQ